VNLSRGVFWLCSTTALASSFVLFAIEPLLAKLLLPWFGGVPAVWNAALLFFQATLLLGYALAHVLARLGTRRYALIHAVAFALAGLALPLHLDASLAPRWAPGLRVLAMLGFGAGLPFLALSTNSPMLGSQLASLEHVAERDAYSVVAASNLGSIAALLAYPFVIEPYVPLSQQVQLAGYAYGALAVLIIASASVALRARMVTTTVSRSSEPIAWRKRGRWFVLAAIPAAQLAAVTQYLTTDVAPAPLLWVVPLLIYLLSFVLVFSRRLRPPHAWMCRVLPLPAAMTVFTLASNSNHPTAIIASVHLLAFFFSAMVCHGELADDRPPPDRLTELYLWMAAGGVGGSLVVALVAPALLDRNAEYPLLIVLALCMRRAPASAGGARAEPRYATDLAIAAGALVLTISIAHIAAWFHVTGHLLMTMIGVPVLLVYSTLSRPLRFALGLAAVMIGSSTFVPYGPTLLHTRSFYGALLVTKTADATRMQLVHGTTLHGAQSLDPATRRVALSYYHPSGPIGDVFARHAQIHAADAGVAVVGLGSGSLATYARPGERWTFYEINPDIVRIATDPRYFTYLSDAFPGMRSVRIELGDARLGLMRSHERYAVLVIDAFASDAIPVHLLTTEAMRTYADHLRDDGLLAIHCSNNYVDLEPVVAMLAEGAGFSAYMRADRALTQAQFDLGKAASQWVVMARRAEDLGPALRSEPWHPARRGTLAQAWTDDASSIVPFLR
jgi:spermidine synthase